MDSPPTTVNDILRMNLNQAVPESPAAQDTAQVTAQVQVGQAHESAPITQEQPETRQESQPDQQKQVVDSRMQKVIAQAQQVRAEREAFKREQDQRAADLRELEQYRALKQRAKDDPVAVAETFGYKPDEYAAALVDKGAMTPERRKLLEQDQEIKGLKQWQATQVQRERQQTEQQQYNSVMGEIAAFTENAGESFDLVRRTQSYPQVFAKIQQHYQQTHAMGDPEVLPYEQACEMVEQELFDKVYAPVLDSPKIKAKFGAVTSVPAPQSAPQSAPAVRTPSGTITPKMRGQSSPPRQMSEAESLEAAGRLLFKGFAGR